MRDRKLRDAHVGEFRWTPRQHVALWRQELRPCVSEWWPRSLLVSDRRPLKCCSRRRDVNAGVYGWRFVSAEMVKNLSAAVRPMRCWQRFRVNPTHFRRIIVYGASD